MTLRTRNNILSAQDYYPYGGTVEKTTPVTPDQLNDALSTKYKPQKGL